MPNKNYLILSLAIILLIGSYALFSAGYESEVDRSPKETEKEVESSNGKVEREIKEEQNEVEDEKIDEKEAERDEKEEESEEEHEETEEDSPVESTVSLVESNPRNIVDCHYKVENVASPKGVSFRPNEDEFWATSLMNKNYGLAVFNSDTGERLRDIQLPGGGGVEIIFNEDGSKAYVSQMETGRVFEVDANSKEITNTYDTGSSWTKVLTLKDNLIYASNWSGNDISIIDINSGLQRRIPSTTTPRGIYLEDNFLYIAGFANGVIERKNLETGEAEELISTGGAMRDLVGTEKYIYASDMANATVYRVNKDTGEVGKFVETENNPNTLRVAEREEVLVVSNRGINHESGNYNIPGPEWGSLLFFNLESGELLDVVIGGNQPTGLDISEEKSLLVYSNFLDNNLVVCEFPDSQKWKDSPSEMTTDYKEKIKK